MNNHLELFLQALESNNYKQCTKDYRDGKEFCVLGILNEIFHQHVPGYIWTRKVNSVRDFEWRLKNTKTGGDGFPEVAAWYGIQDTRLLMPALLPNGDNRRNRGPVSIFILLCHLNDNYGYTFKEIAGYLRQNLPPSIKDSS